MWSNNIRRGKEEKFGLNERVQFLPFSLFFPFNYMWEIFSFSTIFWANSQFFFLHLYVKFLASHSKNLRAPQKFFIFAQKRKFDISENLYKNANFIFLGTKRKFDFLSILCLNRKFDFIYGVARKKFVSEKNWFFL